MLCRFPGLAAAAVVLLAAAGDARATMPMLSSEPFPASPSACQKWANSQSGDALDMWGLNEDGSWSREVAVLRLTLTCLGGGRPEIVGFGSSVGFDDAYCTKHREFGICKKRAAGKPTVSADEFVFGSSGVANSGNAAEGIRISEQIGPSALKRRFRAYTVRIAKGEDCLTCATISGRPGIIEVDYGPDGKTVRGVASRDEKSSDMFGNRVGGSLAAATGAVARCDAGMELTCASSKLKGLSYIVAEDDKCQVEVGEGDKLSHIPDCAKIGGLRIFR